MCNLCICMGAILITPQILPYSVLSPTPILNLFRGSREYVCLPSYSEAHGKEVFVYELNVSISYSFSPLCVGSFWPLLFSDLSFFFSISGKAILSKCDTICFLAHASSLFLRATSFLWLKRNVAISTHQETITPIVLSLLRDVFFFDRPYTFQI